MTEYCRVLAARHEFALTVQVYATNANLGQGGSPEDESEFQTGNLREVVQTEEILQSWEGRHRQLARRIKQDQ